MKEEFEGGRIERWQEAEREGGREGSRQAGREYRVGRRDSEGTT